MLNDQYTSTELKILSLLHDAGTRGCHAYELAEPVSHRQYGWTPQMAAAWIGQRTRRLRDLGVVVRERTNGVNWCYYTRDWFTERSSAS